MGAGGIKRHVHIEGERGGRQMWRGRSWESKRGETGRERGEGRCGGVGRGRVRGRKQGERGGKADVEG